MKPEFDVKVIDRQNNCVVCGNRKHNRDSFFCGPCGSRYARTADERERMV